jgi:hypothetical protein
MCITRIADKPALPIARVSGVVFLLRFCFSVSRTRLVLIRLASLRVLRGGYYYHPETLLPLLLLFSRDIVI